MLGPEEITAYCLSIMNQPLEQADAIVALTGDGYGRINESAKLYQQSLAPFIMVTGANSLLYKKPALMASDFKKYLAEKCHIHLDYIIVDDLAGNTPEQAQSVLTESKNRQWKKLIVVASGDHIVRAYLTFLKTFLKAGYPIRLLAHPSYAPWFAEDSQLQVELKERGARFVKEEWPRIIRYQKQGDLATWQELELYLREQKL